MNANDFYVVFEKELDQLEVELILKYWKFYEDDSLKFLNTIKSLTLNTDFKNTSQVSTFVSERCYLTSTCLDFSCKICKSAFKASSREHFKRIIDAESICEECKIVEINKEAKDILKIMKYDIDENNYFSVDFFECNTSYLEKIYLFIILSEFDVKENGLINRWDSFSMKKYSKEFDFILGSLIEKNVIFRVKFEAELDSYIRYMQNFFCRNKFILDPSIIDQYRPISEKIPSQGFYLRRAKEDDSYQDWMIEIFQGIQNSILSDNDINILRNYIQYIQLNKVYVLLNTVKEAYAIDVEQNIALDSIFIFLINNYSLQHIYNIFCYQAEKTTTIIHVKTKGGKVKLSYTEKSKIFRSKVEAYLNYLSAQNKKHEHTKPLPFNWHTTHIEYFTSIHIFQEGINWASLSTQEIISKWLNSPTVRVLDS